MAIYTSDNGVVREIEQVNFGWYGTTKHIPAMKAGVDGVNRDLLNITNQIQKLEIDVYDIDVYTVDSNGDFEERDGSSLATAKKYGTVTVGTSSITVTCTTRYKGIDLMYIPRIVFKDGCKENLSYLMNRLKGEATFSLNVYGYEYFRGDGYYANACMGVPILENYVNNSASKTVTITNDNYTRAYGWLHSIRTASGTTTSEQQFLKFTFNDTSIPFTVVNNLKQEEDK